MSKLYVANPSQQKINFNYRDPRDNQLKFLEILSGGNAVFPGDFNDDQSIKMINQLEFYGARNGAEIYATVPNFLGLLWRIGDPMSSDEIMLGNSALNDTLQSRAAVEATKAALGTAQAALDDSKGPSAREVSLEIKQVPAKGSLPKDAVNMTLGVAKDGTAPLPKVS